MQTKVSVGTTTKAGYAATVVGLIAVALVAVFDVDQEDAALIASAVWTIVAFGITQWGRYVQAREQAKVAPLYAGADETVPETPEVRVGEGDTRHCAPQLDGGE